jgi:hypothetical protein
LWHIKCRRFPSLSLPPSLALGMMIASIAAIFGLTFGSVSAYQSRPCGYYEPSGQQCGSNWSLPSLAVYNAFSKVCAFCPAPHPSTLHPSPLTPRPVHISVLPPCPA